MTAAVSASFLLSWADGVDMYSYWASIVVGLVTAYTAAACLRPRLAALALACLYAAISVSALGTSGLLWGGILIGGSVPSMGEDRGSVAQVSVNVLRGPRLIAGQQRAGVGEHDRVVCGTSTPTAP